MNCTGRVEPGFLCVFGMLSQLDPVQKNTSDFEGSSQGSAGES